MMTRKDFEKMADGLAVEYSIAQPGEARLAVWRSTLMVADVCAQSNERFNRDRFYVAVFGTLDIWSVRDENIRLSFEAAGLPFYGGSRADRACDCCGRAVNHDGLCLDCRTVA